MHSTSRRHASKSKAICPGSLPKKMVVPVRAGVATSAGQNAFCFLAPVSLEDLRKGAASGMACRPLVLPSRSEASALPSAALLDRPTEAPSRSSPSCFSAPSPSPFRIRKLPTPGRRFPLPAADTLSPAFGPGQEIMHGREASRLFRFMYRSASRLPGPPAHALPQLFTELFVLLQESDFGTQQSEFTVSEHAVQGVVAALSKTSVQSCIRGAAQALQDVPQSYVGTGEGNLASSSLGLLRLLVFRRLTWCRAPSPKLPSIVRALSIGEVTSVKGHWMPARTLNYRRHGGSSPRTNPLQLRTPGCAVQQAHAQKLLRPHSPCLAALYKASDRLAKILNEKSAVLSVLVRVGLQSGWRACRCNARLASEPAVDCPERYRHATGGLPRFGIPDYGSLPANGVIAEMSTSVLQGLHEDLAALLGEKPPCCRHDLTLRVCSGSHRSHPTL
eukprot:scaffold923_cov256-Pinguiococcus_pyrenoidosus.AAC.5